MAAVCAPVRESDDALRHEVLGRVIVALDLAARVLDGDDPWRGACAGIRDHIAETLERA